MCFLFPPLGKQITITEHHFQIIFPIIFIAEPPLNPIAEVLSQCCVSGEDLALKGDACANIKPPLDIVPEDLISSCFFSSEICCASRVRIEQCKHGVLAAKDGLDCHENGTDYYTGCCESCKIGLVIGDRGGDCRFVSNKIEIVNHATKVNQTNILLQLETVRMGYTI